MYREWRDVEHFCVGILEIVKASETVVVKPRAEVSMKLGLLGAKNLFEWSFH